jgi:hypothetical protein
MMGRCADCSWWEKNSHDEYGYCHLISDYSDRERPEVKSAELRGYEDSELHTKPDFGCVLFSRVVAA